MAITDLQSLQDEVQSFADRSDVTDAMVLTFVGLMEGKLYAGERTIDGRGWIRKPLRIRGMIATGTTTPSSGAADLSSDLTRYIEMERVYWTGTPGRTLEYLAPKDFWSRKAAYDSGTPSFYTTEGFTLRVAPIDGTALSVAYYQRFAALADPTDTNWVLTNHPAVYLHGVLAESYEWEQNDSMRDFHVARFNGLVNGLDASEEWASASGSPLIMRPAVVV